MLFPAMCLYPPRRVEFDDLNAMFFCKLVKSYPFGNIQHRAKGRAIADNNLCACFQYLFGNNFYDRRVGDNTLFRTAFL